MFTLHHDVIGSNINCQSGSRYIGRPDEIRWRWMGRTGSFSMWAESALKRTRQHWKKFRPPDYQDWPKLSSITIQSSTNISSIDIQAFSLKSSTITERANFTILHMFAVHYSKKNWNSGDWILIKSNPVAGWLTPSTETLRFILLFNIMSY